MHLTPTLSYTYNALEPYMDAQTLHLHHDVHHQGYVDKLNAALEGNPYLLTRSIEELLVHLEEIPDDIETAVRDFGGGHFNHSLLWETLSPHPQTRPEGMFAASLMENFKDLRTFQTEFNKQAVELFGSGYVWLCLNSSQELLIKCTSNQDCPLSHGLKPLLLVDVWEHAYYLSYHNDRERYLEGYWHLVDWAVVEQRWKRYHSLHESAFATAS